jgi:copper chaperone
MTTRLRVPDASCGHCKDTIEKAVLSIDAVNAAELDLGSKGLSVEHDGTLKTEELVSSITAAGYTAELG